MAKILARRSRDKAATGHDPVNLCRNCKRCRREIDRLFEIDRAFFDANPDRRLYCREFIEGELPPEATEGLPAGYRPVTVSWLIGRDDSGQYRLRTPFGWPLLMRCPNESDRAIIAAFGHIDGYGQRWQVGAPH